MQDRLPDHTPNLPTDRRALLVGIGGLAAGAFLAGTANAGPLNPPPGPIGPTPGPEPRIPINEQNTPGNPAYAFRITQPGSYFLPQRLIGQPGKNGIEITASDVSIDLMGFDLLGPGGVGVGILTTGPSGQIRNVTVMNGSVRNWASGLLLHATSGRLHNINAENNNRGIEVESAFMITGCSAIGNSGTGIRGINRCTITNCIAHSNGFAGISASRSSMITGCSAINNAFGINLGSGSTISGCVVESNSGLGIFGESDNVITHNKILNNLNNNGLGIGIVVTRQGNIIDGNNIILQSPGITTLEANNIIVRNSIRAASPPLDLVVGNTVGPTVDATNIATNSNPHANYMY